VSFLLASFSICISLFSFAVLLSVSVCVRMTVKRDAVLLDGVKDVLARFFIAEKRRK
jgi:hypothetical protein